MRATRIEELNERESLPLVVRARFEKTFLGMGLFAAAILFVCGGYLLLEAIRNPLGANDTAVLAAGFTLALGGSLIIFLVWPRGRSEMAKHQDSVPCPEYLKGPVLTVYGQAMQNRLEAKRVLGESKHLPGPM
jgi:hypothetical protein